MQMSYPAVLWDEVLAQQVNTAVDIRYQNPC